MDWSTQPDPFRRYLGAHLYQLRVQTPEDGPHYDAVWSRDSMTPTPINRHSVSRLFLDSLALSAWKRAGGSTWSLRVNPSAGNLHPTEGYLAVRVAAWSFSGGNFDVTWIPSARVIFDLDDPDASRAVIPIGQSGQFQDARYADHLKPWAEGRDFAFPFTSAGVARETVSTLVLTP